MNLDSFNIWNKIKQQTENKSRNIFCKVRDIWYIRVGRNIGFEQNGKGPEFSRPVLVYKKFNNDIFWGIPLSTKLKHNKYNYHFEMFDVETRKTSEVTSSAVLSQLRLFDVKRLENKIGYIEKNNFLEIKKILTKLISE